MRTLSGGAEMSKWVEVECEIAAQRRTKDPFGNVLELHPGRLLGRMCVGPLVIPDVLSPDSAVCRNQTVFRTIDGALWMHSMVAGLIDLWFPKGIVLHEPHFREEYDAVLDGILDTRANYEFKTDSGAHIQGYLKYSAIKAFITVERRSLAVDLEWQVIQRGLDSDSKLVRYGHHIPHERMLFLDSHREYTEHRSISGERVFTDCIRLRELPIGCGDIAESSLAIEVLNESTDG